MVLSLSEWYELVEDPELMQGDILDNCPVISPPADFKLPAERGDDVIEIRLWSQNVIIMSQSCDIVSGQKSGLWLVLLCPIWTLTSASENNSFLKSNFGREECRRGHMSGYHMISGCDHEKWMREISIVSFREVWSLPLDFVRNYSRKLTPRPRMRSPYREHLAQAFARYFMRVGLPTEVPPFKSDRSEEETIKRLNVMDEETRKRIFSYFK